MMKILRESAGLTQAEAAKQLNINVGFLSRVENGKVQLPARHIKKAAKLFKVPVTKLVNLRIQEFAKDLRDLVDKTMPLRCDIKLK